MTIKTEIHGAVAHIILARPDKLNAISPEMMQNLGDAALDLQKNRDVRAVVIRGEGRAFSAGGDIGTMTGFDLVAGRLRLQRAHRAITAIANMDKPVIAAVRGPTVGVGWSVALACDLVVASETTRFGAVFKKIGLAPDGGMAFFLTHYIGVLRTRELLMSARLVEAKEALSMGLVTEIVADQELETRASALAEELAQSATFALAMGKRMLWAAVQPGLESFLDAEAHIQNLALRSDDHREGAAAFREKRQPKFVGH